jgi:hypothetical protein
MLDGKVQYEPYTDYNKASERLEEIKNKGVKTRKQERYTTLLEKIDGIIVAIDVLENLKPSLIELLNEVRNEQ